VQPLVVSTDAGLNRYGTRVGRREPGGSDLLSARLGLLLAISAISAVSGEARAWDGELRATAQSFAQRVPEEVLFSRLRTQTLSSTTAAEQLSAQLHLLGHVETRPVPELGLRVGLDTGLMEVVALEGESRFLVDGRAFEDRAAETLFLGETYVELELGASGWTELRLGKLRPRLGAGALFDAYAFGLYADADLSLLADPLPLAFRLHVLLPDATFTAEGKESPLLELEAAVRLGRGAELRLLGAVLRDGDDGAVPVLRDAAVRGGLERLEATRQETAGDLRPALRPAANRAFARLSGAVERAAATGALFDLRTEGWLGWTGALLTVDRPGLRVEAVALLGVGELDVTVSPGLLLELLAERELEALAPRALGDLEGGGRVPLLSGLGQVTFRVRLFEEVDLEGFVLALTGDSGLQPGADERYESFVALAPLLPHTSLFFNGGVAQSLASPTIASPAPDGAGLVSGGLFVDAYPNTWLHVRSGLALMASTVPSAATGGRVHGLEGNVLVDALLGERALAYVDLAVLAPFGYYGELDPGLQLIAGVSTLIDGL
jgi:hypothetical protein